MELALLALGVVVVTAALILVEAEQEHQLSPSLLHLGLGYLTLFTLAHVVVRRTAQWCGCHSWVSRWDGKATR